MHKIIYPKIRNIHLVLYVTVKVQKTMDQLRNNTSAIATIKQINKKVARSKTDIEFSVLKITQSLERLQKKSISFFVTKKKKKMFSYFKLQRCK